MGLVSNDLKTIVDNLSTAKNAINTKYQIMRDGSVNDQQDLEHLYIRELTNSIEKIQCLNTSNGDVDMSKVLEGTVVYSQGEKRVGTMKDHQAIIDYLYEEHSCIDMTEGHYPQGRIEIQTQEKTITPSQELQLIEPDDKHVLSRVFVAGIATQEKTVYPNTKRQEINPDEGKLINKIIVEGDENLIPENVRKGISIFGTTGTLEEANPTYNIVYVINEYGKIAEIQNVEFDKMFNISDKEPESINGHTFKGWGISPQDTSPLYSKGQSINTNLVNKGETFILYAIWEQNKPPSEPSITFAYSNNSQLNEDGIETAIITITSGIDPEGKEVINTLECIGGQKKYLTLEKISNTEYKAKFEKCGPYIFLATSTDPYGLENSSAANAMIAKEDGSFGGAGDFTTEGSSGVYRSELTELVDGCYISSIWFEVTVNGGHSASSDTMSIDVYKTDGTSETIQLFYGDFRGNVLNHVDKSFALSDDIRQVKFFASSPHPGCVSSNSTIKWNVEYKFDMSLYKGE